MRGGCLHQNGLVERRFLCWVECCGLGDPRPQYAFFHASAFRITPRQSPASPALPTASLHPGARQIVIRSSRKMHTPHRLGEVRPDLRQLAQRERMPLAANGQRLLC